MTTKICTAAPDLGDLFEVRFDLGDQVSASTPLDRAIFTFRDTPPRQELLDMAPAYCDVGEDAELAARCHPKTKIICSYHNCEKTPQDLEEILRRMQRLPAAVYKMATTAHSFLDTLRMLTFARKHQVLGLCMGEDGLLTRLLAEPWTYAPATPRAPGQIPFDEMPQVSFSTKVLGLIGWPLPQSPTWKIHNKVYAALGLDALYVRMRVPPEALAEFFSLLPTLNFGGASVTMPHKEAAMSHLLEVTDTARGIGAVNTLSSGLGGDNTDAGGALDALERKGAVRGKHVVIMGAGGAARAIAYEALARGAQVTLVNRTFERAQRVAQELGCEAAREVPKHYDRLVQSTPVDLPVVADMDVRTGKGGEEMWIGQALRQLRVWFGDDLDFKTAEAVMREELGAH